MHNNDILRSLRFAFDRSDTQMARLFELGGFPLSVEQTRACMGHEGEPGAIPCSDNELEAFLDGLIVDRRGPPDPHRPPPPWVELSNNEVLKKLRIAMKFRDEDMIRVAELGGQRLSKAELSALFRRPGHRSFRPCGNQLLRRFLRGLTRELRPAA